MNRRSFLRLLGYGTVAAAAASITDFDVERALWLPGEKTIFIPEEFSGNTLITPDWITMEALKMFKNNLKLVEHFNRSWDSPRFAAA